MIYSELVTLARKIAPADLYGLPIYVLLSGDTGIPSVFADSTALGLCAKNLDMAAQPWLASQGRWEGRGLAVFCNDKRLKESSVSDAGGDTTLATELFRLRLISTFIHELSHALTGDVTPSALPPDTAGKVTRYLMSEWTPPIQRSAGRLPRPWASHELDYIRTLCHAAIRAETLLGRKLAEQWLLPSGFHLSRWFHYAGTLATEIDAMADSPFSAIHELPLPEDFLSLWRDDISRYYRHQEKLKCGENLTQAEDR